VKFVKPLAVITALIGLAVLPMSAGAAQPKTLWVAPPSVVVAVSSAASPAVTATSCATATYHTIQSAISAAPVGATINICTGTYVEQLTLTQSVSLVAVGAVSVQLPANPANSETACDNAPGNGPYEPDQDGVLICGNATVSITGITVDAAWGQTRAATASTGSSWPAEPH
jgi:pectin methylesterase-like acyl-CoA thioesterase